MPRVQGRFSQPCEHCGNPTTPQIHAHQRRFCTTKCFYASRRASRPKKACIICGKEIQSYYAGTKRLIVNVGPTCSQECGGILRRRRKQVNCQWCDHHFEAKRGASSKFCSMSCRKLAMRDPRNPPRDGNCWILKCWTCGFEFRRRTTHASRPRNRAYCSKECRQKGTRGPNSPMWRGHRRHYRGDDWPEKKAEARSRDNLRCQYLNCGFIETKTASVHVDHIIPWLVHKRNDLINLMCLCQWHHVQKTHAERYFLAGNMLSFRARLNQLGCPEGRLNEALAWWGAL